MSERENGITVWAAAIRSKNGENMSEQHYRQRLDDTRQSLTHRFVIQSEQGGEYTCYLTVGLYPNGQPGELFLNVGKMGSTLKGAFDSFAIMVSIALQYGVPLPAVIKKFRHVSFEPSGRTTGDVRIESCSSIVDYVAQWLGMLYWGEHLVDRCERVASEWICPPDCPVEAE